MCRMTEVLLGGIMVEEGDDEKKWRTGLTYGLKVSKITICIIYRKNTIYLEKKILVVGLSSGGRNFYVWWDGCRQRNTVGKF